MHRPNVLFTALLTLSLLLLTAADSLAVTPANTLIRNTATLTATGLPAGGITASVDVKVNLVTQKPTLSRPTVLTQMPDDNSVAGGQASTANYRLTNNANGPDTFAITQESYAATNLAGDSGTVSYTLTSISLGATSASVATGAGATSLTVPYDGTGSGAGGPVNALIAGSLVRIDNFDYTIASVSEDPTTNTAIINLSTALQAAVGIGELIREYKLFNMTIATVGSVTTGGSPAYINVSTRATSQADNTQFDADSTTDTATNGSNGHRTNIVSISFNKYVRNVTTPNGTGVPSIFNGENFFSTAAVVTAAPGETLEYAMVIVTTAAGLPGPALTDTVPDFTTYQANSTYKDGVTLIPDVGGNLPLISGYFLGDIAGAQTIVVTFRVTVNN